MTARRLKPMLLGVLLLALAGGCGGGGQKGKNQDYDRPATPKTNGQ